MFNHSPSFPASWAQTGAGVAFSSPSPVAAGSEVMNNYGPKSNARLLLLYGFALPDNDEDTYPLALGGPPPPRMPGGGEREKGDGEKGDKGGSCNVVEVHEIRSVRSRLGPQVPAGLWAAIRRRRAGGGGRTANDATTTTTNRSLSTRTTSRL